MAGTQLLQLVLVAVRQIPYWLEPEIKVKLGLEPEDCGMGYKHPNQHVNHSTKYLPLALL